LPPPTIEHERSAPIFLPLRQLLERLSRSSQEAYRRLLDLPRFHVLTDRPTTIDALEPQPDRLASSRRTGKPASLTCETIPGYSVGPRRVHGPGWFGRIGIEGTPEGGIGQYPGPTAQPGRSCITCYQYRIQYPPVPTWNDAGLRRFGGGYELREVS